MLASPAARARAAEAGLDLATIAGSGPGGAVLLADVDAHRPAAAPAAAPSTDAPAAPADAPADGATDGAAAWAADGAAAGAAAGAADGAAGDPADGTAPAIPRTAGGKPGLDMAEMRRAIAAAMGRSKREIPHYYLSHRIDLQAAQNRLTETNAGRSPDRRLLLGALLIRATVRALARVPELNGRFDGPDYAPSPAVHCGMAVALRGGGLIAPAILEAQDKGPDAIMAAMRDLVARTRTGRLRGSELTRGTITVSSLGERGVDALFGVIYPPQVALVGFGAPRPEPVVHDGAVVVRPCLTATLAADHRVSDGRRGAAFLAEIDRLLQEPDTP